MEKDYGYIRRYIPTYIEGYRGMKPIEGDIDGGSTI